jgi:hypothetical protein
MDSSTTAIDSPPTLRFNYHIMTFSKFCTLLLVIATAGLVSCASSKDAITKVNYYKFSGKKGVVSADPAISFEQKYYLYGAVSNEEIEAREGTYYRVRWTVIDRTQPVKLVLKYRQAKTGSTIYTQEVTPDRIKSKNTTELSVIGEDYKTKGHVTAWKISLVRGKDELASHQSYLWD